MRGYIPPQPPADPSRVQADRSLLQEAVSVSAGQNRAIVAAVTNRGRIIRRGGQIGNRIIVRGGQTRDRIMLRGGQARGRILARGGQTRGGRPVGYTIIGGQTRGGAISASKSILKEAYRNNPTVRAVSSVSSTPVSGVGDCPTSITMTDVTYSAESQNIGRGGIQIRDVTHRRGTGLYIGRKRKFFTPKKVSRCVKPNVVIDLNTPEKQRTSSGDSIIEISDTPEKASNTTMDCRVELTDFVKKYPLSKGGYTKRIVGHLLADAKKRRTSIARTAQAPLTGSSKPRTPKKPKRVIRKKSTPGTSKSTPSPPTKYSAIVCGTQGTPPTSRSPVKSVKDICKERKRAALIHANMPVRKTLADRDLAANLSNAIKTLNSSNVNSSSGSKSLSLKRGVVASPEVDDGSDDDLIVVRVSSPPKPSAGEGTSHTVGAKVTSNPHCVSRTSHSTTPADHASSKPVTSTTTQSPRLTNIVSSRPSSHGSPNSSTSTLLKVKTITPKAPRRQLSVPKTNSLDKSTSGTNVKGSNPPTNNSSSRPTARSSPKPTGVPIKKPINSPATSGSVVKHSSDVSVQSTNGTRTKPLPKNTTPALKRPGYSPSSAALTKDAPFNRPVSCSSSVVTQPKTKPSTASNATPTTITYTKTKPTGTTTPKVTLKRPTNHAKPTSASQTKPTNVRDAKVTSAHHNKETTGSQSKTTTTPQMKTTTTPQRKTTTTPQRKTTTTPQTKATTTPQRKTTTTPQTKTTITPQRKSTASARPKHSTVGPPRLIPDKSRTSPNNCRVTSSVDLKQTESDMPSEHRNKLMLTSTVKRSSHGKRRSVSEDQLVNCPLSPVVSPVRSPVRSPAQMSDEHSITSSDQPMDVGDPDCVIILD